jgi:hypothetical protein
MHGDRPVAVSQLHDDLQDALDPQKRGRQYLASQVQRLAGTRMASFVLLRQAPAGKWGKATYALKKTTEDGDHRAHRGYRGESQPFDQYDAARADYGTDEDGAEGV